MEKIRNILIDWKTFVLNEDERDKITIKTQQRLRILNNYLEKNCALQLKKFF